MNYLQKHQLLFLKIGKVALLLFCTVRKRNDKTNKQTKKKNTLS